MQQPKDLETPPLYPNNIGWCIKKQGYTQEEVADAIGIARRTLSNYITGKRAIPSYYLEKIAKTIGCKMEELTSPSVYRYELPSFPVLHEERKAGRPSMLQVDQDLSAPTVAREQSKHLMNCSMLR